MTVPPQAGHASGALATASATCGAPNQPGKADANLYAYVSGKALQATDPLGLREASENTTEAYQQGQADGRTLTTAAIELNDEVAKAEGLISKSSMRDKLRNAHDPAKRDEIRAGLIAEYKNRIEKGQRKYDNAVEGGSSAAV